MAFDAVGGSQLLGYGPGDGVRRLAVNALANGVVGGIANELQGGKFGHGFLSAGLSALAKPAIRGAFGTNAGNKPYRIAARAALGGAISAATGGKFANGAVTAAFAQAYNEEPTLAKDRPSYSDMAKNFPNKDRKEVFEEVGGRVADNWRIPKDQGGWRNACTVRVSVALNKSGSPLPFIKGKTVSGANKAWHLFRVRDLRDLLTRSWGAPTV